MKYYDRWYSFNFILICNLLKFLSIWNSKYYM